MPLSIAKLNSLSIRLLTVVGVVLWGANSALAQQYSNDNNKRSIERQYNANVVVYKNCDFGGEAREVPVGDFASLTTLRIANDSISSIKIHRGYAVTIYQHDRFGGDSAIASDNIRCLNRQWNDQISSLRVSHNDREQYGGRGNSDNANRRAYSDRQQGNHNNSDNGGSVGDHRARVNGHNLTNVSYAASQLDYLQNGVWRQTKRRGSTNDFAETSRDKNSVYLQSQNTGERIRVDLFSNDVTIVRQNGEQRKFPITDMRAGNLVAARPTAPARTPPNRVIHGACFNYKAYTLGGKGGIRFHGHDGFHSFQTKGHTDRVCHDGALTMEINKTSPSTVVVVEINGQTYRFDKNDKADAFKNTWYRKKVALIVQGH